VEDLNEVVDEANEDQLSARSRGDSDSSIVDAANRCGLSKTSSTGSVRSERSERSMRSVRSVNAVGSFPYGSLRVHSPSPTRGGNPIHKHEVLKAGDVVIIREVPAGSLVGYDFKAFTIKEVDQFEGIKNLPPGAHFIWGGSREGSVRTGFWIMTSKKASDEFGEAHVLRWDKEGETLAEEVTEAEKRFQRDNLPEIVDGLQAYDSSLPMVAPPGPKDKNAKRSSSVPPAIPVMDSTLWARLTSCMKGAMLTRITKHSWNRWKVSSSTDEKVPDIIFRMEGKVDLSEDVLHFIFPNADRTFSEHTYGRERTEQAMDTSAHIMAVIAGVCTYEDSDEIIGELQFCFVTGMTLGNIACMEQWANIVSVVFRAFRLALDYPVFFRKVIQAVHAQFICDEHAYDSSIMDHDPKFADELKMILTTFKSRLNEQLLSQGSKLTDDQSAVGKAFEELESWLWKWGWDLRGNYVRSGKVQLEDGEYVDMELKDFEAEDERGEYAPVIVELDEDGRERDLITW